MTEAKARDPVGLIDIAQIEEDGLAQCGFQSVEIEGSKLVPFGHEDQRVCSLCRLIGVFAGDEVQELSDRLPLARRDRRRELWRPVSRVLARWPGPAHPVGRSYWA